MAFKAILTKFKQEDSRFFEAPPPNPLGEGDISSATKYTLMTVISSYS